MVDPLGEPGAQRQDAPAATPEGGTGPSLDGGTGPSPAHDRERLSPRASAIGLSAFVTALLLLVMAVVPPPYAVEAPGPTVDTLSEVDGVPLIEVEGAQTYATEGSLSLTTVSVRGGPRNPVDLVDVVRSWLSGTDAVVPVEQVYPRERSAEELADILAAQMTSSQENAAVAALTELGYDVPAELRVAAAIAGSGADGVLDEGDVLLVAGGTPLPTFQVLSDLLRGTPPGTSLGVEFLRAGERRSGSVLTTEDGGGGSRLGVLLEPLYDLPVDVSIRIEEIGGPSAGLMFALGIVDVLTPGALTGGEQISGTGTISADGEVGVISGVTKKLAGAARDGASYFLSPSGNCAEVSGATPNGLRVVGVASLTDARAAVAAIGEGRAADLPGCPA